MSDDFWGFWNPPLYLIQNNHPLRKLLLLSLRHFLPKFGEVKVLTILSDQSKKVFANATVLKPN